MYIQFNIAKVNLAHKDDFVRIIESAELKALFHHTKGYRDSYLVQSVVDPEEFASVTMWDSGEDAMAFLTGPEYAAIVGGVRDFLLAPLDRKGYQVVIEVEKAG